MISCARRSGSAARQVDLVEDRDDLESGVEREEEVAEVVCAWMPCDGVHHQDGALARGQRAGHLVGEVHVAGGVDQVELVLDAVPAGVVHPDGVQLDRDAALALEVHRVEELRAHLALLDRSRRLDQAVGQGGLAVVDVRDDAEVADAGLGHGRKYNGARVTPSRRVPPAAPSPGAGAESRCCRPRPAPREHLEELLPGHALPHGTG